LSGIEGIKEVTTLKSNLFRANAFIDRNENNLIPQLQTELFFESVPDRVIDIKTSEWQWPKSDSVVPLIIPKDYLNLYNFGFAPGQDLPQISENAIRLLQFKIRIKGNNKSAVYNAFIAGFSSRINSILVPDNFLSYANKEFGEKKQGNPSRLIVVCKDPSNEKLQSYLQENGIETNEELLKSGRLNSVLNIMISIVSLIGFIIIFLAVMNIIQYAQLLIVQSDYEIKTLILLGFSYKSISFYYFKLILTLMLIISGLSYFILYQLNNSICKFITEKGYQTEGAIYNSVHLCALVLIFLISSLSSVIIHLQVRKIAKISKIK
jgi:ABC-type antimicrobial peptide transport system permease subunit